MGVVVLGVTAAFAAPAGARTAAELVGVELA